jgi:hypothetical protein
MNAEIDSLIDQAAAIGEDAQRTFGHLSPQQLNWKPAPERWSVGQCFVHLITSNSGYLPIIDGLITGRRKSRLREKLPVLPALWGKLLIKSLEPTQARKMKAPKKFEPAQSDVSGGIIHEFVVQQCLIMDKMKMTANLNLERIVITSPALSLVTYSLMDAYRIIVVHERRHFQQAQRVSEESGFPTT